MGTANGGLTRSRGPLVRRVGAAANAGALIALVACDLWVGGVRHWGDAHSFLTDVVSSLLVLGITVFILDEVIAQRQRNERAVSVAVQGLIVYGQAVRAYNVVAGGLGAQPPASGRDGDRLDGDRLEGISEEIRSLGNMILVASPSLFDDPEARLFLEQVQRLAAALYAVVARLRSGTAGGQGEVAASLKELKSLLDVRLSPLAKRVPGRERALLDSVASQAGD